MDIVEVATGRLMLEFDDDKRPEKKRKDEFDTYLKKAMSGFACIL